MYRLTINVVVIMCLALAYSTAGLAQPVISKSFSPAIVLAGAGTTLTITITNPTGNPMDVNVADHMPAGMGIDFFSTITCGSMSLTTLFNHATEGFLDLSIAVTPMAANSTCTFNFTINPLAVGVYHNTATVTYGTDRVPGNPASATVAVSRGDFQVGYAANTQAGESWINITNTAAQGEALLGPGFGGSVGNLCVNAYAFSPDEQLISCCSCLITPNGIVNLGVNRDLTIKTLTGVVPTSVVVKLIATIAGGNGTGTSCSNTAATAGSSTSPLAPIGMAAWRTTLHASPTGFATSEVPFLPATLSPAELASMTYRCSSILGNGSGYGVCLGCRTGALGAAKAN